MKRLTNFVVNKRNIILSAMLILTAVCAFLIPKVSVNSDMTKYLPDDSSMKQGISPVSYTHLDVYKRQILT